LILNDTISDANYLTEGTLIGNSDNTFNYTFTSAGEFNWTVNCTDTVGNIGTNDTPWNYYVDNSVPTAVIVTSNNTWFNDPTPQISFNITDNLDIILNYTFYVNNVSDVNGTANSGVISTDDLNSLSNGTYRVILEAWDELNQHVNSTEIIIYIDTVSPNVALLAPANRSNETQDVNLNFTVTDNMDIGLQCNITIDGEVNISFIEAENATNVSRTVTDIPIGYHNWSVICVDNASNVGYGETWYFNITPPDLYINATLIVFNNTSPIEGDNITINATVHNIGYSDANNVVVQFFNGDPDVDGVQIGNDQTIDVVAGSSTAVNVTWIAELGTSYIFVRIDPSNTITEMDETNNEANKSITVGSWHIVYGENVGDLIISDIENLKVFSWYIANSSSGNVFAADYESSIVWANLTAIGINITGSKSTNDFEEIDTALNSTQYGDSVNRSFTSNGGSVGQTSFIVFKNTISNVSIINSTNNSNFVTGILWDKSDDVAGQHDGEYNGTEDLVFVTKINPQKQGKYGVYDFEIRVPSELKKYKKVDIYSVVFYVELK